MADRQTQPSLDRRIRRTQQLITEAFLSLCQEKDYEEIIIKDITEQANVNRSTFYAHYQDKDDLLSSLMNDMLSKLGSLPFLPQDQASAYVPDNEKPDPYFLHLFEHLAGNAVFYRVMLGRMPAPGFADRMTEVIRESFYRRISAIRNDQKLLIPLELLLDYTSHSTMGIITKWLAQQMIYSPHHMSLQLTRLSLLGVYRAMGMEEH
ncbi:TetR/AcrR family transcriptional regulator [Paenibacillus puerhi]|uniref:TetR/AcrR family transcriptional regulator n=1 Tax=Paenibacillus puerhi TaxID=2692622 RepID=UPI00135BB1C2|nr:TetR/AcrR family transcriptional regulator [Paenibacillus puerhi]